MKTIVVAIQKGGVGKTATAVHLAFDFYEKKNLKVALIDLDPQGNASYTLQNYASGLNSGDMFSDLDVDGHFSAKEISDSTLQLISADTKLVDLANRDINSLIKSFNQNLSKLDRYFNVVLIDTAPSLSNGMVSALYSADYVLSPIILDAYSIQGIKMMLTTISNVKKANKNLNFLGMLPTMVDGRNTSHKQYLEELRGAYPKLITPVQMGMKKSISEALAGGVPVWRIKKTAARKAANEFSVVADYVFKGASLDKMQRSIEGKK